MNALKLSKPRDVTAFLVVEDDRFDDGSFVHERAYATQAEAMRRIERLERRDGAEYSMFRVKPVRVLLPNNEDDSHRARSARS